MTCGLRDLCFVVRFAFFVSVGTLFLLDCEEGDRMKRWYLVIGKSIILGIFVGIIIFIVFKVASSSNVNKASNLDEKGNKNSISKTNEAFNNTKELAKLSKARPYYDKETFEFYCNDFDVPQFINEHKSAWDEKRASIVPVYQFDDLQYNDYYKGNLLGFDRGYFGLTFSSSRGDNLQKMLYSLETEAIRESKDKTYLYLMYDTEEGIRVYIFIPNDEGYQYPNGFIVPMKKKLEYRDFSEIKIGDSSKEVDKIDPASGYLYTYNDRITDAILKRNVEWGGYPTTVHLLTDGVLKIIYERTPDKEYIISDIIFAEDYVLDDLDGKTCYQIHPDDYVEE